MTGRRQAFTLVELLIVVTVIAILSAIALPNLLEAQTRAKVAAARNNVRVLAGALEIYCLDNNQYPHTRRTFPDDPLGLMADVQLRTLLQPIAYISPSVFHDPFGDPRPVDYFGEVGGPSASGIVNRGHALLYYNYQDLAVNWAMPCLDRRGGAVLSLGPDHQDSLGAYRPFPVSCFAQMYPGAYKQAQPHPINSEYDPTNGTVSRGDLMGFVGKGREWYGQ